MSDRIAIVSAEMPYGSSASFSIMVYRLSAITLFNATSASFHPQILCGAGELELFSEKSPETTQSHGSKGGEIGFSRDHVAGWFRGKEYQSGSAHLRRGTALSEVILTVLAYCLPPLVLGFLLSLIGKRFLGILCLFLAYVFLAALWPGASFVYFAGPFVMNSLSWFFTFYLVPALTGYGTGLVLDGRHARKGKSSRNRNRFKRETLGAERTT